MKVNVNFKKRGGGGSIFFFGKPLVRHALTIVVDSFLMYFLYLLGVIGTSYTETGHLFGAGPPVRAGSRLSHHCS